MEEGGKSTKLGGKTRTIQAKKWQVLVNSETIKPLGRLKTCSCRTVQIVHAADSVPIKQKHDR